jgi:hypothetical protein
MRSVQYLICVCASAFAVGAADANTITTFDANGAFVNPAGAVLSGTVAIDVTAGALVGTDLNVTGLSNFTTIFNSAFFGTNTWKVRVGNRSELFEFQIALLQHPSRLYWRPNQF